MGCSERRVVYFRKLLFKYDKKKPSFRRVEEPTRQTDPQTDSCRAKQYQLAGSTRTDNKHEVVQR